MEINLPPHGSVGKCSPGDSNGAKAPDCACPSGFSYFSGLSSAPNSGSWVWGQKPAPFLQERPTKMPASPRRALLSLTSRAAELRLQSPLGRA